MKGRQLSPEWQQAIGGFRKRKELNEEVVEFLSKNRGARKGDFLFWGILGYSITYGKPRRTAVR